MGKKTLYRETVKVTRDDVGEAESVGFLLWTDRLETEIQTAILDCVGHECTIIVQKGRRIQ